MEQTTSSSKPSEAMFSQDQGGGKSKGQTGLPSTWGRPHLEGLGFALPVEGILYKLSVDRYNENWAEFKRVFQELMKASGQTEVLELAQHRENCQQEQEA